jgi:L-threonate 2-dehydrogenase
MSHNAPRKKDWLMKRPRRTRGTVGQVGLGIMGGAFARHLLAAGYNVIGYDVAPAAFRALARATK